MPRPLRRVVTIPPAGTWPEQEGSVAVEPFWYSRIANRAVKGSGNDIAVSILGPIRPGDKADDIVPAGMSVVQNYGGEHDPPADSLHLLNLGAGAVDVMVETSTWDSPIINLRHRLTPRVRNLLSAENASFEGGTGGNWWGAGAPAEASTDCALIGTHSLKLTAAGDADMAAYIDYTPTAGQTITFLGSFRAAATSRPLCLIEFHSLGIASAPLADNPAGWTQLSLTHTFAPGEDVPGTFWMRVNGCLAGEVHYIDCMSIAQGTSTVWTPGR